MKYIAIIIFACSNFLNLNAQESKITLSTERKKDNSIDIKFKKHDPGSYTVVLYFSNLQNSNYTNRAISTKGYHGSVTSLRPIDKERPVTFNSYRYRSIRGRLKPKINTNVTYLIPYTEGTLTTVREATYLGSTYFGKEKPEDWRSYTFYCPEQSEVTASRKGIVVELVNNENDQHLQDVNYTAKVNYIIIEHEDGTLLRYSGFARGSVSVKIGEIVYPGEVIGKNAQLKNSGYGISYMLYYLKSDEIDREENNRSKGVYGFVTPNFLTDSGIGILENNKKYTATIKDDIIQQEMSKREINRHKKTK